MSKYLTLLALLALAACSEPAPKMQVVPGYAPGDYRVSQLFVTPSPELTAGVMSGKAADFKKFKELLQPLVVQQMPSYDRGTQNVGLTITVRNIRGAPDDAYDVLLGNGARVWTEVTLWDPATGQVIGTVPLEVIGNTTAWPRGSTAHTDTPDKNMADLAKHYMSALIAVLYPKP